MCSWATISFHDVDLLPYEPVVSCNLFEENVDGQDILIEVWCCITLHKLILHIESAIVHSLGHLFVLLFVLGNVFCCR